MASSSKSAKDQVTYEVQLVSNDVRQPDLKVIPKVAYKDDPSSALSMIPSKVVMVQDVWKCYSCKVGTVGDAEIREAYNNLCENGILKDEYAIVERKGLTRSLEFPTVFKTEWIKIVLSKIHDGCIWLEGGPIKITKKIVHRVIGYPTLDKPRAL